MSILEQITPFRVYGPTKAQEIAGKLETLIIESQLEAGALLATKEDLRRRFEVSPATMNEAIPILESCGLIVMRPGMKGGIFIATSSLRIALRRTLLELNRPPACHTGLAEAVATYRRAVDAIASKDEQRLFSLPESPIGAYAYT